MSITWNIVMVPSILCKSKASIKTTPSKWATWAAGEGLLPLPEVSVSWQSECKEREKIQCNQCKCIHTIAGILSDVYTCMYCLFQVSEKITSPVVKQRFLRSLQDLHDHWEGCKERETQEAWTLSGKKSWLHYNWTCMYIGCSVVPRPSHVFIVLHRTWDVPGMRLVGCEN